MLKRSQPFYSQICMRVLRLNRQNLSYLLRQTEWSRNCRMATALVLNPNRNFQSEFFRKETDKMLLDSRFNFLGERWPVLPICALAWFKAIVELNGKSSNLWQPPAKDLPRTVNDHGAAQKFPRHSSQLFCGCRKAHIGSGSAQKVRRRSLSPKDETVSKRRLILQPMRHFSNCNTLTEKPVVISPALMDEPTVTVGTSRNKTEQPYHWSRSPWVFQSKSLPAEKYMPEVGNGHIATMVNTSWVHMNGLYDGERTKSSRARIPSLVAFNAKTSAQLVNQTFELNTREGIFTEISYFENPSLTIKREVFAHRDNDRLLVAHISFARPNGGNDKGDRLEITFDNCLNEEQLSSEDIHFSPTSTFTVTNDTSEITFKRADGKTKAPEVPEMGPSPVSLLWNSTLKTLSLEPGSEANVHMYAFIGSSFDENLTAARKYIDMSYQQVKQEHINRWSAYWNNGRIDVDPAENFQLAQALNGSLYYLLSSLPNKERSGNRYIGLSPGGLARGPVNSNYSGHVFWDTETWMYPPILNFYPDLAQIILEYRVATLDEAKENAKLTGHEGARFAWESAFTGKETSPWSFSGDYEVHITGDIAFAVRQLLYVIDDQMKVIQDLRLEEMAVEMARFWQSRSTCTDPDGECHILNVMPPDEYHHPVDDSVYTNYVAKLALELPAYIFRITGGSHPDCERWLSTAKRLVMPKGGSNGKQFHLEFAGFTPGILHPKSIVEVPEIKQADVILLGYPLDMQMSAEIRQNDLQMYRKVTDLAGPAMTWGMFAVGYLELGNLEEANSLFEKNYENIVQPFGVWSEVSGGEGCLNFLTGMGGFLQAVINGYGGIRIREDHITLHPQPLPQTSKWSLVGYKYLGYQLDMLFDFGQNNMTIRTVNKSTTAPLLELRTESGQLHDLSQIGQALVMPIERSIIRAHAATSE